MKNIYNKLNKFRVIVGSIKKDGNNPHYRSKYATIESVLDTIETPLKEVKLGFYQSVNELNLKTVVYDEESGETIESNIPLLMAKQDMQQLGSAITYARRYALVSMFGLEQEDDDGNYASGKSTTQQKPAVKNYSISEVETLAKTKNILIENICKGYKIESLGVANQQLLNTIYGALLKK